MNSQDNYQSCLYDNIDHNEEVIQFDNDSVHVNRTKYALPKCHTTPTNINYSHANTH